MQHQVDHRHIDEVLAGLREEFVVLAEAAIAIEPGERAFDDPAFGQNLESLGRIASLDDLKIAIGEFLGPPLQLSRVGPVGPNLRQPRALEPYLLYHLLRPVAVLHVGRMHDHADDQPQGIDDNMALASFNLLASVVTARRPPFSVVLTDWLSKIAALGVAWRPFSSRSRSWSLS